jgi:SAM-dependent methyltransferase
MKRKKEWFNDENFWGNYAPVMFDDAHWAEIPPTADGVTGLARLDQYGDSPPGKRGKPPDCTESGPKEPRLLDLCCGFGRFSAEFARRGFAVTGVDITETYLRTAREEAAYENLAVEYVQADIRDFRRPGFFDLAVNLYISFGYFDDEHEDRAVLRNVYESLKPGGVFIMETLGKEMAVRDFIEAEWFERAGYTVLTEYEALDSWTRLKNRWILIKDGERREKIFTQRLYAASELRALFLETGFTAVGIYGDWDESPYDQRAPKLIVAGYK